MCFRILTTTYLQLSLNLFKLKNKHEVTISGASFAVLYYHLIWPSFVKKAVSHKGHTITLVGLYPVVIAGRYPNLLYAGRDTL